MDHEAKVQQAELRRRLAADGNGAAADALRVEAAGFAEACDFKEVLHELLVAAEAVYPSIAERLLENPILTLIGKKPTRQQRWVPKPAQPFPPLVARSYAYLSFIAYNIMPAYSAMKWLHSCRITSCMTTNLPLSVT